MSDKQPLAAGWCRVKNLSLVFNNGKDWFVHSKTGLSSLVAPPPVPTDLSDTKENDQIDDEIDEMDDGSQRPCKKPKLSNFPASGTGTV